MTDDAADTERTVVKTYVPRYQKAAWREAAESMDMSQSEFVRTMVQAGRRGFVDGADGGVDEPRSGSATPGVDALEDRLLDVLVAGEYTSWDRLVEEVLGGGEDRLEAALQELVDAGQVEHSPRRGGYALRGGDDE